MRQSTVDRGISKSIFASRQEIFMSVQCFSFLTHSLHLLTNRQHLNRSNVSMIQEILLRMRVSQYQVQIECAQVIHYS